MKTDRELLELAARAAGFSGEFDENTGDIWRGVGVLSWNSLKYDGDALRLAVDLEITPITRHFGCDATNGEGAAAYERWSQSGSDRYAATRRAITRAAAQIQLNKEQDNGK